MAIIIAPFTVEQQQRIQIFQSRSGAFALYCQECEGCFNHKMMPLQISRDRMYCVYCQSYQDWVHSFMTMPYEEFIGQLNNCRTILKQIGLSTLHANVLTCNVPSSLPLDKDHYPFLNIEEIASATDEEILQRCRFLQQKGLAIIRRYIPYNSDGLEVIKSLYGRLSDEQREQFKQWMK